ncbi:MAG: RluA family pseudouridine synthase [Verrucomicrobia bacterium]|nr:RluA family pseudouridine synthase [Verrucomicrobiota bacterium]
MAESEPTFTRIEWPKSLPGGRLDQALREHLPSVSRGTVRRLIQEGHLRVNGAPVKPTYSPRAGDQVEISWPAPRPAVAQPQAIPLEILFEDEHLIVLNKSAGIAVHPSAGHDEHTLVNALLHYCEGKLSGIGGVARPGIVHRLDLETSGCLIVAKDDLTHIHLARQFAERTVRKYYLALVCGDVVKDAGEIRAAIARHVSHRKRMAVAIGEGREARTGYEVVERFRSATLVRVQLFTGRTHQIRVHFQHLGYPLVGDEVYGKRQHQRFTEATGIEVNRQMLHALEISFTHPATQRSMKFSAPWPADLGNVLARLRENRNRLS